MNQSLAFTRSHRRSAVVSLTPLIDVVFMLLLFFMLATSFDRWRSIELSAGSNRLAAAPSDRQTLVLTVTTDRLLLAGEQVTAPDVSQRLQSLPENTRLVVRPDERVVLQRLISVMDELALAGIEQPVLSID